MEVEAKREYLKQEHNIEGSYTREQLLFTEKPVITHCTPTVFQGLAWEFKTSLFSEQDRPKCLFPPLLENDRGHSLNPATSVVGFGCKLSPMGSSCV